MTKETLASLHAKVPSFKSSSRLVCSEEKEEVYVIIEKDEKFARMNDAIPY